MPLCRPAPNDPNIPQRKVPQSVCECFDLIEREMFEGPWVMGGTYTICDSYLFTLAQFLESDGVDPARFPKILAFRSRMFERPAVKRALADKMRYGTAAGRLHALIVQ